MQGHARCRHGRRQRNMRCEYHGEGWSGLSNGEAEHYANHPCHSASKNFSKSLKWSVGPLIISPQLWASGGEGEGATLRKKRPQQGKNRSSLAEMVISESTWHEMQAALASLSLNTGRVAGPENRVLHQPATATARAMQNQPPCTAPPSSFLAARTHPLLIPDSMPLW